MCIRDRAQYSISDNGILVFLKGVHNPEYQLTVLDAETNKSIALVGKKEVFGQYSISPDGQKVAVEVESNQISDISILDVKRSKFNSFAGKRKNYTPVWSPDGNKIYYTSNRNDPKYFDIYEYELSERTEKKMEIEGSPMGVLNIS